MEDGVDGLLRDKTRPPGKTPPAPEPVAKIVGLTHTLAASRGDPLDAAGDGEGCEGVPLRGSGRSGRRMA